MYKSIILKDLTTVAKQLFLLNAAIVSLIIMKPFIYLVPKRLVLNPKNTERINLPKLAAFTGSNLFSEQ